MFCAECVVDQLKTSQLCFISDVSDATGEQKKRPTFIRHRFTQRLGIKSEKAFLIDRKATLCRLTVS